MRDAVINKKWWAVRVYKCIEFTKDIVSSMRGSDINHNNNAQAASGITEDSY